MRDDCGAGYLPGKHPVNVLHSTDLSKPPDSGLYNPMPADHLFPSLRAPACKVGRMTVGPLNKSLHSPTLSTPDNIGINVKKRLHFSVSLEGGHDLSSAKDKSLADIADNLNWRSRANENGIKVSFSNDNSNYQADSCERIYLLYMSFY